jgi:SAM-dependent methyltransferase
MVGGVRGDGWRYVGVDPAAAMLREGRAVCGVLAVGQARAEALPFRPAAFDAVLAMGVLEYLDDPGAALDELCRVTKPGGRVIVTMPNRLSPYRLWTRSLYRPAAAAVKALLGRPTAPALRRREFIARVWSQRVAAAGMTVTDVVYYGFNVFLPPLDRLLPRAAARVATALESLGDSPIGVLGTGFILAAEKVVAHPGPSRP